MLLDLGEMNPPRTSASQKHPNFKVGRRPPQRIFALSTQEGDLLWVLHPPCST